VDHPERLPSAPVVETTPAPQSGWLSGINARIVGETSVILGAGRQKKEDSIDHGVGVVVHHKVGDRVEEGQPLFTVYAKTPADAAQARQRLLAAHAWKDHPVDPLPLFYDVVS